MYLTKFDKHKEDIYFILWYGLEFMFDLFRFKFDKYLQQPMSTYIGRYLTALLFLEFCWIKNENSLPESDA